jgi:hypothetical protein
VDKNNPFDEQQCTFEFMPWGTPKELLVLSTNGDQAGLGYFYPHSDWELLEYSTEVTEAIFGTVFSFNLRIKRRALYYGVMIIAPTVLFALMNPLVFLLPVESGERVGLAMAILLSYAIFLPHYNTFKSWSYRVLVFFVVIFHSYNYTKYNNTAYNNDNNHNNEKCTHGI